MVALAGCQDSISGAFPSEDGPGGGHHALGPAGEGRLPILPPLGPEGAGIGLKGNENLLHVAKGC